MAYAAGIIQGYTPNKFAPDDTITREQMAVMAVKALKLGDLASSKNFTDQSKVAAWAGKAIITAVSHGIIEGYADDTFRPQTYATRAEAITLIWRVLEQKL
ncbi:Cellulosome-anchoring protein precursor [compost metagenome]